RVRDVAAKGPPPDGQQNLRRAARLLLRSRGPAYENSPLAGCLADALGVVRPGNFDPVQRRRTRLSSECRFTHADAANINEFHALGIDPKLNRGMNGGASRIERAAQRRTALSRDI